MPPSHHPSTRPTPGGVIGLCLLAFIAACSRGSGTANVPEASAAAVDDPSCDPAWLAPPAVDPSIAVPADAGHLLARFVASGTQNYVCQVWTDAGGGWSLSGPEAALRSCTGTSAGRHFASDAGAMMPEWLTPDGTYVVASKVSAVTPDGGADAVPWVLLRAAGHGGRGALSRVTYIQRVATHGGLAPGGRCEAGERHGVPYTADYYFYGR